MFYKGDFVFTSEATFRGHPDKVCDQIADSILDEFLATDPDARAAIEVMIHPNRVAVAGETYSKFHLSNTQIDFIIRDTLMKIGYVDNASFAWDNVNVSVNLYNQSPEICNAACFLTEEEKASDQGNVFGYAINHNDLLIPDPSHYSHQIVRVMEKYIFDKGLDGIGPDGKCQVTFGFEGGKAVAVKRLVISIMHDSNYNAVSLKNLFMPLLKKVFAPRFKLDPKSVLFNPSGSFKIGGPESDVGLTGRKIMVDTYGGFALHGGGSFSGKDPSKLDRSGSYALRHLAKNIVANGIADECLLQTAYAIGVKDPISFFCRTGNAKLDKKLTKELPKLYDLSPFAIRSRLKLNKPIYSPTASHGHFGYKYNNDGLFTWEALNLKKILS